MGILDRFAKRKKPDFSNVRSGSSTTAPAPAARSSSTSPRSYMVQKGDTLSKIAAHYYGDAGKWRRIYEANRGTIKDPDLIYPGQTFTIPE